MMKQPADNPNANALEEKLAAARTKPEVDPAEEFAEIEAEAKRLAAERTADDTGSAAEWQRAADIVRNRRKACSKA